MKTDTHDTPQTAPKTVVLTEEQARLAVDAIMHAIGDSCSRSRSERLDMLATAIAEQLLK